MKRFVTSYDGRNGRYAGHVDALDWEHAEQLASEKGHVVDGILYLQVEGDVEPNKLTAAMAECSYTPPDISEFGE